MNRAEKALQYFIIAVPEDKEQAEAYFWARRALNAAIRAERVAGEPGSMLTNADLLARAEAAEARAEKAEKERDAAIEHLHGYCQACKNYTQNHCEGPCAQCKYEYYQYRDTDALDNWEWAGKKEE